MNKKYNVSLIAVLLFSTLFQVNINAQDSTRFTGKPFVWKDRQELGVNFTMLLKQVFNLSNSTLPTLPYDITYKYHFRQFNLRAGLGVQMDNSQVSSSITSSSQNQTPSGPDPLVPSVTQSFNFFDRAGVERKIVLDSRVCIYYGLDFAGQVGNSSSQTSATFNNLPASYSYSKTLDDTKTEAYGGGAVAGVQLFLSKKLSLFTEIPVYVFYSKTTEVTDNYTDHYNSNGSSSNPGYISTDNKNTVISKNTKLSITLPVTLYMAFTF